MLWAWCRDPRIAAPFRTLSHAAVHFLPRLEMLSCTAVTCQHCAFQMAPEAAVLAATVILVALGLLFGFSNGFHDAANAVATVIATKSLTPRQAVYSSALFNFLPCLVQVKPSRWNYRHLSLNAQAFNNKTKAHIL